tara:strand:- start:241 stop:462 length:222 start_codon:yes stop_codon:yes gene_type:complete
MKSKKKLLKKALGILIHLSELSGRAKSDHKNAHGFKSPNYYQSKREQLKELIINYSDDIKIFNEKLISFQSEL